MNNNITLPPIKHVFQELFTTNIQSKRFPPVSETIVPEPTKSFAINIPCYYCPPSCCTTQPMNTRFVSSSSSSSSSSNGGGGGGHRRAVSASTEMVNYQQPMQHARPHFQEVNIPYRRARAHTTAGYPPTMLFEPHVYNNDNNQQINGSQMIMRTENTKSSTINNHRYHCQYCRKSFSRPSSLRIHIYSHTGEKPFKCHHQGCGRSFSVHSNMRRHLRVHYYPQQQQHNSMRLPIVPTKNYDEMMRNDYNSVTESLHT
ncbi:hypothetical protein BDF21DRAFT_430911 [Thamnidium elegans]|nr:hypothetical protein BDF21DRAFT_430911 [Thamnidium elegans]